MKKLLGMLAVAVAAGCAAPEPQTGVQTRAITAQRAGCEPAPKELVVKDLEPGKGRVVGFRTAVLVVYTGWLYDPCAPDHKGVEFDSNSGQRVPLGFMVGAGRVIKGWEEGLIGMVEGGKRQLVIPPDKAYGERSVGKIPPNATLVFDVNLVQIGFQPPASDPPKQ
jgi:FKBP-type peptidyl-prolyl cis-trans isomerase FkpA